MMTPEPPIEELLAKLTADFGGQKSLVPEVLARLAHEAIAPPRAVRFPRLLLTAAATILITFGLYLLIHPAPQPQPIDSHPSASLQLDNLTITQNLAIPIDARTVLVAWSYHLSVSPTLPPLSTAPIARENYTELPLRSAITPGGDIYCCSLFIANPKIIPAITPPTILIHLSQNQIISFGASMPQPQSPAPLSNIDWGPPSATPLNYPEIRNVLIATKLEG